MRTSTIVLNKAKEVSAAYKLLKPYVKEEEYFAYINGLHAAIQLLQDYEEGIDLQLKDPEAGKRQAKAHKG